MAVLRGLALAAIAVGASACYAPALDSCTVHCPNNEPCPGSLSCGSDSFCHPPGDSSDCRTTAQFAVTVTKSGDGIVIDDSGKIGCGTTCAADFMPGATVNLSASGTTDQNGITRFAVWSGDCSGTQSTCTLTMDGDKMAGARFNAAAQLMVNMAFASGATGTVSFDPPAPDCTASCMHLFDIGTTVTLTASTPNTFLGFSSPDCNSPTPCVEVMNGPITVNAMFGP